VTVERTEEDYKANLEPQLDKAVEVILGWLQSSEPKFDFKRIWHVKIHQEVKNVFQR